jgi:hypothetical protein
MSKKNEKTYEKEEKRHHKAFEHEEDVHEKREKKYLKSPKVRKGAMKGCDKKKKK